MAEKHKHLETHNVDHKTGKLRTPWHTIGQVTKRDMAPVNVNSPGPRQKYSAAAGKLGNYNINNLEEIRNSKILASAQINTILQNAKNV